jgi:MFS family permease
VTQGTERPARRSVFGAIHDFFGLNSSMIALLAMVVLVGMGEKMAERFLPLYLMAIGGTTWAVGSLNGMDNLLSALYSFPGGFLSDMLGYRKALIVFNVVAMAGYLIVILVPT